MRVLTRPNVGGPTVQAVALWHAHRALGVQTLLAVGRCRGETALDLVALGVPRLDAHAVDHGSAGFVEVPAMGNRWSPIGHRRAKGQLRDLARAFAPDVVHTHTSKAGWLGRRAARAAGVPVVAHTFHGHVLRDYFGPLRSWLLGRLEAAMAARTDLLFAVSPSCRDELVALGIAPRERLLVLPPAVPLPPLLSRTAARAALGISDDVWLCACMGRLVPIKRADRFVAAVAQLPQCAGHVYGDGPLGPALAEAARGVAIEFRGADPQARALLSAYDALVIPSAREGCPLVAVEAFAAGVPVVGFAVPGVCDVLGSWGGGVSVPERLGAAGLAAALLRLRREPGLRAQVTAAGRAALPRYAPAEVAAALQREYAEALLRIRYAGGRGG